MILICWHFFSEYFRRKRKNGGGGGGWGLSACGEEDEEDEEEDKKEDDDDGETQYGAKSIANSDDENDAMMFWRVIMSWRWFTNDVYVRNIFFSSCSCWLLP